MILLLQPGFCKTNISIWWSQIKSFTNRDFERRDLIFSKTHLIVWCFHSVKVFVLRFSGFAPPVFIDLFNFVGVGADTVIMGFWGGSIRWEAADKCVRLQLCILVSTLGRHVFGWLINSSIFLENESRSFQSGMDAVSPHQTRFSPERLPIIYVTHVVLFHYRRRE